MTKIQPRGQKLDEGQKETDKILQDLEDRIRAEYNQAEREITAKIAKYNQAFVTKDKIWQRWVAEGKKTQQDYTAWKTSQIAVGERWEEMRQGIAQDLLNTSKICKSITQGYMPEVYALNHDYGTYGIETAAGGIDTSYTLYSREAAERIFRDNPQMLPGPGKKVSQDIADGKALRYNNTRIQSAMLQAILQGNKITDIATRVSNAVGGMERGAAIRNARTMVTSAQNAGRYDAFRRADSMGVDLKIEWIATLDMRTRHTHRVLDGQQREVGEPFEVDGYTILYPGQLEENEQTDFPQSMLWNCRCSLRGVVAGWKSYAKEHRSDAALEGMSYDEWKESKVEKTKPITRPDEREDEERAGWIRKYRGYGGPVASGRDTTLNVDYAGPATKAPQTPPSQVPAQQTAPQSKAISPYAEKIIDIRERVLASGQPLTESDILEAGKILAQEYEDYKKDALKAYESAQKAYEDYIEQSGYKEAKEKYYGYVRKHGWNAELPAEIEEAGQKFINLEASEERYALLDKVEAAKKDYHGTFRDNAEWLKNKLSDIRDMGSEGMDIKSHLNNSRSKARAFVEDAYNCYPTDWVKDSVNRGNLKVGMVKRGYYNNWKNELMLSDRGEDSTFGTALHELGHRFEYTVDGIKEAEKAFYDRRTAGEDLKWLGSGYGKDEKTRKDDFIEPYMGKDYGGRAFELVSMGFQYAYTEPYTLAQDKDMEAWIYGLLCLR